MQTLENDNSVRGIWLIDSSSTIDSVQFAGFNASLDYYSCGVLIQGGNPLIQNSTFKNNAYGIKIEDGAAPLIQDNTFTENGAPIYSLDSYPSLSGNQFLNNDINGILIKGDISQNTTWQAGITYVVDYYLGVLSGATLTLEPGVVIKPKAPFAVVGYFFWKSIKHNKHGLNPAV